MPDPSDESTPRKILPRGKGLSAKKKEEPVNANRSLEEYQKLACNWDPNAPRPTEPDTPGLSKPAEKTAKGRRTRAPKGV